MLESTLRTDVNVSKNSPIYDCQRLESSLMLIVKTHLLKRYFSILKF